MREPRHVPNLLSFMYQGSLPGIAYCGILENWLLELFQRIRLDCLRITEAIKLLGKVDEGFTLAQQFTQTQRFSNLTN